MIRRESKRSFKGKVIVFRFQINPTEEEKAAIRESTLDKHYVIENEDEMEEKAIEAEREKGFDVSLDGLTATKMFRLL